MERDVSPIGTRMEDKEIYDRSIVINGDAGEINFQSFVMRFVDWNIYHGIYQHQRKEMVLMMTAKVFENGRSQAVEKNRLALALLLANIEILDFDAVAAESYGKIRADLEKQGTPIGPLELDMMIAGHAKSLNYTVVTNNTKGFGRVKDLKLENWAE